MSYLPFSKSEPVIGAAFLFLAGSSPFLSAGTLAWSLPQSQTQLLSDGITPIPANTEFHLGVFAGSFVPDAGNQASWTANWRSADFEFFIAELSTVQGSYVVEANASPFTAGKQMYVWGIHRKPDGTSEQWLGTAETWLVPTDDPLDTPVFIDIDDATTVLRGIANSEDGTIRMAAIAAGGTMPIIYGDAWRDHYFTASEMANTVIGGWQADPDGDSLTNTLEYAMGTNPLDQESKGSLGIAKVSGGSLLSFPGWPSAAVGIGMEESSTLQPPWLPLGSAPAFNYINSRWELTVPFDGPKNFYRAAVAVTPMP